MARLGQRIVVLVKGWLVPACDEVAGIVSWRSHRLREQASHWYAAAKRMAWDIAIRLEMMRELGSGIDDYTRRVNALHRKLGVPRDYPQRGMPFHREASDLVAVPCGIDGEHRWMTPATRSQWLALQAAAAADGITILVRAAFRSVDAQARLIREELSFGGDIDQLLTGIAAPGYSQHHTGRALDIERTGVDFENTPAFEWLCRNAAPYGFELSYPRGNPYGIMYEPWHWYCNIEKISRGPNRSGLGQA